MTLPARYSGVCPECGERWQPGDLIRADADQVWKHATCPNWIPVDLLIGTACPVCWLVHPNVPGACDKE